VTTAVEIRRSAVMGYCYYLSKRASELAAACERSATLRFILVEPLQAATDNQPHIFRNVALVDLDVSAELASRIAELASRIKDFPLLDQMSVYLLDEEGSNLRLGGGERGI
jgi:hypothetical protein